MGYGSRALSLLVDFYEGKFTSLSESTSEPSDSMTRITDTDLTSASLLTDNIKIRDIASMPPLFSKLSERRSPMLDYIGVSYGLTQPLHKFWKRALFAPVYLRQTTNELTGEHTCVMLRVLSTGSNDSAWLAAFARDFQRRFLALLSYQFRSFPSVLALSINESANQGAKIGDTGMSATTKALSKGELDAMFSPFDLKRLDSYANNMLDYHVILDMIPSIANLYFTSRLSPSVSLTGVQSSILLAIGLQRKVLEDVEKELGLEVKQLLAMFVKIVRKVASYFRKIVEEAVESSMPESIPTVAGAAEDQPHNDGNDDDDNSTSNRNTTTNTKSAPHNQHDFTPLPQPLSEDLQSGATTINAELKEKQRALIDALPLSRYEIEEGGAAVEWADAEKQVQKTLRFQDKEEGETGDVTVSVLRPEKEEGKKGGKKKRKGETTAVEVYEKGIGEREAKKLKRGMEKEKRKSKG